MSALSVIPSLSQAYAARVNVPFPDTSSAANVQKSLFHLLYTMLTNQETGGTASGTRSGANIFSVLSSTDGVTYGAADNIGATFSGTKWKSAVSPTTHAHIVMGNGDVDLLLDLNSATAGNGRISIAPHVYPFTSGSTTAGPTSTRESSMRNRTPTAVNFVSLMSDLNVGGSHLAHLTIGADGSFIFFVTRAGTSGASFVLSVTKCNDTQVGDAFPWVMNSWAGSPGVGTPTRTSFLDVGSNCEMTLADGSRFNGSGGTGPALAFGGSSWSTAASDMLNGLPQVYEIEIQSLASPSTLRKGTFRDVLQISGAGVAAQGGGYPIAGPTQVRMVLGGILIPMPALTPTF